MSCCAIPHDPADLDPLRDAILRCLAAFARLLRNHDFTVGLKESADAAVVISQLPVHRPAGLKSALKALFCSRASDWQKFDALFDSHWLPRA